MKWTTYLLIGFALVCLIGGIIYLSHRQDNINLSNLDKDDISGRMLNTETERTGTNTLIIQPEIIGIKIINLDDDAPCRVTGQFELTCEPQKGVIDLKDSEAKILNYNYSLSKEVGKEGEVVKEEVIVKSYNLNSLDTSVTVNTKDNKVIFNLLTLKGGEEFHYGENSTIVVLDYSHDLADGYTYGLATNPRMTQMKWDITDIPASSTIDEARLCLAIIEIVNSSLDLTGQVNISYINNQSWTESVSNILPMTILNRTVEYMTVGSKGSYNCFNVTTALRQSYSLGNRNLTIRIHKGTTTGASSTYTAVATYVGTGIGYYGFATKENTTVGYRPYLNITYTSAGGGGSGSLTADMKPAFTNVSRNQTYALPRQVINFSHIVYDYDTATPQTAVDTYSFWDNFNLAFNGTIQQTSTGSSYGLDEAVMRGQSFTAINSNYMTGGTFYYSPYYNTSQTFERSGTTSSVNINMNNASYFIGESFQVGGNGANTTQVLDSIKLFGYAYAGCTQNVYFYNSNSSDGLEGNVLDFGNKTYTTGTSDIRVYLNNKTILDKGAKYAFITNFSCTGSKPYINQYSPTSYNWGKEITKWSTFEPVMRNYDILFQINGLKIYGNLTFTLYSNDVSLTKPSTVLRNVTVPINTVNLGTAREINYTFTNPYQLQNGLKYWVIASTVNTTLSGYTLVYRATSSYTSGETAYSNNAGSTWIKETNKDYYFKINLAKLSFNKTFNQTIGGTNKSLSILRQLNYSLDIPFTYQLCANDTSNKIGCYNYSYYVYDTAPTSLASFTANIISPETGTHVNGLTTILGDATSGITYGSMQYSLDQATWKNFTGCEVLSIDANGHYPCTWDTTDNVTYVTDTVYYVRILPFNSSGYGNVEVQSIILEIDATQPYFADRNIIYPITSHQQSSAKTGQNILFKLVDVVDLAGTGINNSMINMSNLNGTGWANMNFESGNLTGMNTSVWNYTVYISTTTGSKNVKFTINDSATPQNQVTDYFYSVNIDNDKPTYNNSIFGTSPNITIYNNTEVIFYVKAYDDFGLYTCAFFNNKTGTFINYANDTPAGKDYTCSIPNNVSTGNWSYYFVIYDDAGNLNQTINKTIQVLGDAPADVDIQLVTPPDYTSMSVNYGQFFNVTFNVTCYNDNCGNINVSLEYYNPYSEIDYYVSESGMDIANGAYRQNGYTYDFIPVYEKIGGGAVLYSAGVVGTPWFIASDTESNPWYENVDNQSYSPPLTHYDTTIYGTAPDALVSSVNFVSPDGDVTAEWTMGGLPSSEGHWDRVSKGTREPNEPDTTYGVYSLDDGKIDEYTMTNPGVSATSITMWVYGSGANGNTVIGDIRINGDLLGEKTIVTGETRAWYSQTWNGYWSPTDLATLQTKIIADNTHIGGSLVDEIYLELSVDSVRGLISTTTGAFPFYTNATQNPFVTNLNEGESRLITFWVNATGESGATYTLFAYSNITSNMNASDRTSNWDVTINTYADIVPPTFDDNSPYNMELTVNDNAVQQINATDNSGLNGFYLNSTYSIFNISYDGLFTNYTQLTLGKYYFNVTVNDSSNNFASAVFYVNVTASPNCWSKTNNILFIPTGCLYPIGSGVFG